MEGKDQLARWKGRREVARGQKRRSDRDGIMWKGAQVRKGRKTVGGRSRKEGRKEGVGKEAGRTKKILGRWIERKEVGSLKLRKRVGGKEDKEGRTG